MLKSAAPNSGTSTPKNSILDSTVEEVAAEALTRLSGGEKPLAAVDEVRMARKNMYFTSAKAEKALGYSPRPVSEAFADAVNWFRENGCLG
jgi:dihydroflavonol-4-reductase